jgi:hypothetical protein
VNREGQPFEPEEEPAGGREAEMRPPGNGYLVGCGIAVRRECFSAFGPITERLISGDIALWMRADYVRNGGVLLVPRPLVDYRIHNENTSGRFSLRFSSRAALRASCAALLNNEIAQVVELKKIARYRLSAGLKDAALDRLWSRTFRVTRSRAALVLAIAKRPCREWLFPVVRSLRHRALRPLAVRALALGLCPPAYRIYLRLRGHHI